MGFGALSGVHDLFPPGQFLALSDDDQLRRPGFEAMLAGIRLGPAGGVRTDTGRSTQSDLHHETVYPHQDLPPAHEPFFSLASAAFAVLVAGAAGRSPLRADVRYVATPDPIVLAPAAEVRIARIADLTSPAALPDALTFTRAAEALSSLADAAELQLVALGTETAP